MSIVDQYSSKWGGNKPHIILDYKLGMGVSASPLLWMELPYWGGIRQSAFRWFKMVHQHHSGQRKTPIN